MNIAPVESRSPTPTTLRSTKLDLTSSGSEVVDFLQYVCSNDVDVPIGAILHTGMHNENGNCFLINFGHFNIKSKKN
jgi:hypothetical protein